MISDVFQISIARRIESLKRQNKYSPYIYLLVPIILISLVSLDHIDTTQIIYLTIFFISGLARLYFNYYPHSTNLDNSKLDNSKSNNESRWITYFALLVIIQALLLGSTPKIFLSTESIVNFESFFALLMVATFASIGCTTLSAFPILATAYSLIATLPFCIFFFINAPGLTEGLALVVGTLAFLGINISQSFVLFRNLKEFEKQKAVLKFQDERLSTFANTLPGMLSLFDENLQYKDCNASLLKTLEITKEDLIGKPLGFMQGHSDFTMAVESFSESKDLQRTVELPPNPESKVEPKKFFLCLLSKYHISDIHYISALSLDISAIKNKEKELELARLGINESEKMLTLGEMAAGLAHELNNPMAIISGRVQVIQSKIRHDSIDVSFLKDNLSKILDTVSRVKRIVYSLKAISKNSHDENDVRDYSTTEVLDPLLALNNYRLFFHGIEISLDNSFPKTIVRCSLSDLAQVVLHILKNSVDAIKDQPERWMKIELYQRAQFIQIYFIDSGNGISKNIADRIFEPYFSTKHKSTGTGVGLAAARDMMRKQGGDLYYEASWPNTCFVVELPMGEQRQNLHTA